MKTKSGLYKFYGFLSRQHYGGKDIRGFDADVKSR